jgi:hypothetical protein
VAHGQSDTSGLNWSGEHSRRPESGYRADSIGELSPAAVLASAPISLGI